MEASTTSNSVTRENFNLFLFFPYICVELEALLVIRYTHMHLLMRV